MLKKVKKNSRQLIFCALVAAPWLWSLSVGPWPELIPLVFCGIVFSFLLLFNNVENLPKLCATAWSTVACINVFPIIFQFFGIDLFFWQWLFIPKTNSGYATGLIGQPNLESTFLSIGLISTLFLSSEKNKKTTYLISIWLGVGIALLSSRTGLVEILFLFIFINLFKIERRRFNAILVVCLLSYIFVSINLSEFSQYLGIDDQRNIINRFKNKDSCHSRWYLWSNVIELIEAKPLTGWGWGWDRLRAAQYQTIFSSTRFCGVLGNAHNLPLHLAVTLGVPLASIIIGIVIFLIKKSNPINEEDRWKIMAWWIIFTVLIHSFLEFPLWYGAFQICIFLCVSIIFKNTFSIHRKKIAIFICILISFTSIFIGLDYIKASQAYIPKQYRLSPIRDEDSLEKVVEFSLGTIFFKKEALYAKLMISELNSENANQINKISEYLLDYSPEPKVIVKLIDSSRILGQEDKVKKHMELFRIAFPKQFDEWRSEVNIKN